MLLVREHHENRGVVNFGGGTDEILISSYIEILKYPNVGVDLNVSVLHLYLHEIENRDDIRKGV